jgi:hypothetical protein
MLAEIPVERVAGQMQRESEGAAATCLAGHRFVFFGSFVACKTMHAM